ncbi:hypothetical protein [Marinobacterium mangrovicola]|uniref:Uncharacterized protein n=1 Tax=Marinobacterium mangrovicola TaxID=1476959 RepID=A0A4R1GD08_9GAMM|nr:hypothetical protein [Marinobacterium mangrovicola]TCK05698.1 hypothetical protein CLV83_2626 [Marinobacterium mangrovicola]
MNIWAMDKDQSIRHLLLLLQTRLGESAFRVDEATDCDRCAVFICHPEDPQLRAYLYTLGQAEERYGLHLEYPPSSASAALFDALEGQSLNAVVDSLAVHFDIPVIEPLPGH